MQPEIFIKRQLSATSVIYRETLQSLWSGYGAITRYDVDGVLGLSSLIVKQIRFHHDQKHPRGWQSDFAHQRKLHSYQVEKDWYQGWSNVLSPEYGVAKCYGCYEDSDQLLILLEDLDAAGFDQRKNGLNLDQAQVCLFWLARFHSRFLQDAPSKDWPKMLWGRGTYWHLDTRPDELEAMTEGPLKQYAHKLDDGLKKARFQTLVHGDAKVANFCFSKNFEAVSMVDFQYVGKGVGVQDVAYFLGSCLSEAQLEMHLEFLLDMYFSELGRYIIASGESADTAESVTSEWYGLFPIAWADFHRFLLGWCPTHVKNTHFSQRLTNRAIDIIAHNPKLIIQSS